MKKVIYFVTFILILSTTTVYAQDIFQLVQANYKILINGSEMGSDLPILNYKGYTYVPLRLINEKMGAVVKWDNEQVLITNQFNTSSNDSYMNPKPNPAQCEVIYNTNFDMVQKEKKISGYTFLTYNRQKEVMLNNLTWLSSTTGSPCSVEIENNKVILQIEENEFVKQSRVEFEVGSKKCKINGEDYDLNNQVERIDGKIYYPIKSFLLLKRTYINKYGFGYVDVLLNTQDVVNIYEQFTEVL